MKTTEIEEQVADFVLGMLSDEEEAVFREQLQNDPISGLLVREMKETVATLVAWKEVDVPLPMPRIPMVHQIPILRVSVAAAAAVALLAIQVVALYRLTAGYDLKKELAWMEDTRQVRRQDHMWELHVKLQSADTSQVPNRMPGFGDHERRMGRGLSSNGTQRYVPRNLDLERNFADFVSQFAFSFNVPETLPDGLEFRRALPVGKDCVHLVYAREGRKLGVYLSKSDGPDTSFKALNLHGCTIVAARRRGVLTAFEGAPRDELDWNILADQFVGKKNSREG